MADPQGGGHGSQGHSQPMLSRQAIEDFQARAAHVFAELRAAAAQLPDGQEAVQCLYSLQMDLNRHVIALAQWRGQVTAMQTEATRLWTAANQRAQHLEQKAQAAQQEREARVREDDARREAEYRKQAASLEHDRSRMQRLITEYQAGMAEVSKTKQGLAIKTRKQAECTMSLKSVSIRERQLKEEAALLADQAAELDKLAAKVEEEKESMEADKAVVTHAIKAQLLATEAKRAKAEQMAEAARVRSAEAQALSAEASKMMEAGGAMYVKAQQDQAALAGGLLCLKLDKRALAREREALLEGVTRRETEAAHKAQAARAMASKVQHDQDSHQQRVARELQALHGRESTVEHRARDVVTRERAVGETSGALQAREALVAREEKMVQWKTQELEKWAVGLQEKEKGLAGSLDMAQAKMMKCREEEQRVAQELQALHARERAVGEAAGALQAREAVVAQEEQMMWLKRQALEAWAASLEAKEKTFPGSSMMAGAGLAGPGGQQQPAAGPSSQQHSVDAPPTPPVNDRAGPSRAAVSMGSPAGGNGSGRGSSGDATAAGSRSLESGVSGELAAGPIGGMKKSEDGSCSGGGRDGDGNGTRPSCSGRACGRRPGLFSAAAALSSDHGDKEEDVSAVTDVADMMAGGGSFSGGGGGGGGSGPSAQGMGRRVAEADARGRRSGRKRARGSEDYDDSSSTDCDGADGGSSERPAKRRSTSGAWGAAS